ASQPAAPSEPKTAPDASQPAAPSEPKTASEASQPAAPSEPKTAPDASQPAAPSEPKAIPETSDPAAPSEPKPTSAPNQEPPGHADSGPYQPAGWRGRLVVNRLISTYWPLVPDTRLTAKEVALWFDTPYGWSVAAIVRHYGPPMTTELANDCINCFSDLGSNGLRS
ncbi:MAG: hypothetical protein ABI353_05415, partial [Isosphaeraceae bacterium]